MLDIAAGTIEIYTRTEFHFVAAERLIGRFAFSHRLRTLDALQLAVAVDLSQQNLLDYFVVAGRALAEIGASVNLKVINPENRRLYLTVIPVDIAEANSYRSS